MPSKKRSSTVVMVEGALCVALSVVLSYFDLFRMPQGGTVDFELVPLMIFTYRRGYKSGFLAGFVVGIVKMVMGGYILNPLQAALDYPVAFMCVGLVDIHPKFIGFLCASLGQIGCSVVSGALFFAEYAPPDQSPWVYSLFYNVPTLGTKYIISWAATLILWKALERELPVR